MEQTRRRRVLWGVFAIALACAVPARATEAEGETPPRPYDDTRRFYFYFDTGFNFVFDQGFPTDIGLDTPDGVNVVIGGGGGYNLSEHWGIELQGHGTEPDLRSDSREKVSEYSNITIVPAVRYRWPLRGGRLVPYLTAGVGGSLNDVNDTGDPKVKIRTERSTLAGALSAGLEYFVAPNVAVGVSLHSFLYPDQDTRVTIRNQGNRVVAEESGSVNLTSLALLAHIRLFPGQAGTPGHPGLRRLLLADHGPFDTDARRLYLYALGGHAFLFDHSFGGGVELRDPGDFNATLGGGLGVNLGRHWGAEIQLLNNDPNANLDPFGKFVELSNFTVLPMARYRHPFLGGRLVTFARAGVGVAFFNLNDGREIVDVPSSTGGSATTARTPRLAVDERSWAASIGVGVEYFLNHHLSVGIAVPLYLYPDLDTEVQRGPGKPITRGSVNFTGIGALVEIKAYLP